MGDPYDAIQVRCISPFHTQQDGTGHQKNEGEGVLHAHGCRLGRRLLLLGECVPDISRHYFSLDPIIRPSVDLQ